MADENEYSSGENNVSAAVVAGMDIARAHDRITDYEGIPIAVVPGSMRAEVLKQAIDLADARASRPLRLKGTAQHQELDSFIEHIERFKDEHSVVYADAEKVQLTAVFDYHEKETHEPRWCGHRSVYACPLSAQWKRWLERNERPMSQDEFAQFIDDNMVDLVAAKEGEDFAQPAKVLEMARLLVIRTKGEFERKVDQTTGEFSLVNKLEHETTSTKIPRAFCIGIPVFEGGSGYRIEARLRFSLNGGRPQFSYALYQPEQIKRHAFGEVRAKVKDRTLLPLFVGSPE